MRPRPASPTRAVQVEAAVFVCGRLNEAQVGGVKPLARVITGVPAPFSSPVAGPTRIQGPGHSRVWAPLGPGLWSVGLVLSPLGPPPCAPSPPACALSRKVSGSEAEA